MTSEEIYPYIVVYNGIFEDPEKMYNIVKNIENQKDGIFEEWQQWYSFGKKIENFGIWFDNSSTEMKINTDTKPQNKIQEDQKYFITELVKGFHLVNNDYMQRYNFNIDITEKIQNQHYDASESEDWKTSFPPIVPKWKWTGPSLCKYFDDAGDGKDLSMSYHSDYIREPIVTPGYKFAITTTTYINDDYEGGDLDFVIDDKLIGYKPKAGDFVVFPSGHPTIFTENGNVFLHGVKNLYGGEKYFTRMYWTVFDTGAQEWFDKQKEYGKEKWLSMQEDIMVEYREKVQKKNLDNCVRIR